MARHSPYRAISDPTRRRILDLLRDAGPQRAGDIAARFPAISRPAVSKQSRLVREIPEGRERRYQLNPEPLRKMYDSWLRHYEAFWMERLQTLKRVVEEDEKRRREARKE